MNRILLALCLLAFSFTNVGAQCVPDTNITVNGDIAYVQGSGFNYPDHQHFRIVFLPHEDDLIEAIGRLARFLEGARSRFALQRKSSPSLS